MKKITLIALMLFTALGYAQVGINTNTPDASSALEIESTTGGILIPRLTQTQRDDISAPATGLMIYQTNGTSGFYFWDGAAWTKIDGVAGPQGIQGFAGAAGIDGTDGIDGAAGIDGTDGTDGVDGTNGVAGPQGLQGIQGIQGEIGLTGATGPLGANGTNGINGIDGNVGDQGVAGPQGLQGIQGIQGDTGLQGSAGLDGSPFTLINGVPTCESAQLSSIGSIVLDNSNSNGSLHILTPGPDCSVDPTKLFSVTQPDSGVENVRFYWFFNVSESIYVYDLPEILRYGADSHTVLYKLSDYYETSFDPNADGFNISSSLLTSYLNSSNFVLLEPGYTYCLLSGNVSNYNNPNHYSNTLPEYDSNLFLTLSQWKLGWGGGMYIQTNRWALGVVGEQEGFSYKPVGKIWQTIINW